MCYIAGHTLYNTARLNGHVTAISVGEEHRRLEVAGKLMQFLKDVWPQILSIVCLIQTLLV